MTNSPEDLPGKCQAVLTTGWEKVQDTFRLNPDPPDVITDEDLRQAVRRSVNSTTKTYRYVLPTQLVAKLADPSLDARCVQRGRGGPGAFDARSICDAVTVPFERDNHSVLGGCAEPYVNNPLRVPEITEHYRARRRNKQGWDDLCLVLEEVERRQDTDFTEAVFEQTLTETYRRLATVQVVYRVPQRTSLERAEQLISRYVTVPSGGERVQAIVSALLRTIGSRFQLFDAVQRARIHAADASSGQTADIECLDDAGKILLAVETKDRAVTVRQIQDKLPSLRAQRVSELLFIARKALSEDEQSRIEKLIDREFLSGQNIYVFDVMDFALSLLALLGEDGRREFLEAVGHDLDTYGSAIIHRQAWADLLIGT